MSQLWGLEWRSDNRLDGERRHIIHAFGFPVLFRTRAEARAHRDERYGYIRTRPDLQSAPHGWRMPRPVRVEVRAQ